MRGPVCSQFPCLSNASRMVQEMETEEKREKVEEFPRCPQFFGVTKPLFLFKLHQFLYDCLANEFKMFNQK